VPVRRTAAEWSGSACGTSSSCSSSTGKTQRQHQRSQYARLFNGVQDATRHQIVECLEHLNARAVQSVATLPDPRVVLLRHAVQVPLNRRLVLLAAARARQPIYVWRTYDTTTTGASLAPQQLAALEDAPYHHTRDIPTVGVFFNGIRYVMTENKLPRAHHVRYNGCTGCALLLDPREPPLSPGETVQVLRYLPLAIYVRPDGSDLGQVCTDEPGVPPGCIPVGTTTATIHYGGLPPIRRLSFRLVDGYAVTD
jgi:hypothetical protein